MENTMYKPSMTLVMRSHHVYVRGNRLTYL